MGSSQSTILTSEIALTGIIVLAGAYFFSSKPLIPPSPSSASNEPPSKGKKAAAKKNKNKNRNTPTTALTSSIETLVDTQAPESVPPSLPTPAPSHIEEPAPSKSSKKRKAKTPKTVTPASGSVASLPPPPPADGPSTSSTGNTTTASSVADDDGWTKISKDKSKAEAEDEEASVSGSQTLAERLLPKPAVTAVDDMIDGKPEGIARVIRVKPTDKPPLGFSWADFENVEQVNEDARGSEGRDDNDGWGVVTGRKAARTPKVGTPGASSAETRPKQPEDLTKKQRQNQARKEAQKAAKADAERERLAALARHKRQQENARIAEQYAKGKSKVSGGMKATVDANGSLVWE